MQNATPIETVWIGGDCTDAPARAQLMESTLTDGSYTYFVQVKKMTPGDRGVRGYMCGHSIDIPCIDYKYAKKIILAFAVATGGDVDPEDVDARVARHVAEQEARGAEIAEAAEREAGERHANDLFLDPRR